MSDDTFGRRLRAAREAAGISQATLAERAGLSRPYLARLEGDQQVPGLEVAGRIADALSVTVDSLRPEGPQ